MAIIYSYPLNTPKAADLLIGTIIHEEADPNSPKNKPTVSFTVQSILDLVGTGGGAQTLQQVTNLGATTTNAITISNDLLVSGRYYDSSNQPGAAGQILSSTLVGTQWINNTAAGVTNVSANTAGDALDVLVTNPTTAPDLAFTWAGNNTQLVDGGGNLQTISTYTLPVATSSILGGIKLEDDTEQTVVANAVSATASRTYGLQLNSSDQAVINVPWTDTQENTEWYVRDSADSDKTVDHEKYLKFVTATGSLSTALTGTGTSVDPFLMTLTSPDTQNPFQRITGTGSNNTDSGILLSNSGGTVLVLGAGSVTAAQTGDTITLTGVNTWIANAVTVAGYVAAPAALDANLVWKTDGSGNPAWRVDATIPDTGITGVTLLTATSGGAPLGESITLRELTLTSYEYDGGSNVGYVPVGGTASTYLKGDGTWGAIPTGLQFKGTWDASGGGGGNPDLTAVSPSDGWLYICNVAGTAYPNGGVLPPSAWSLGDWCIYNGTTWTRVPATNAGVTSLTTTDGTYIDLTPNTATTGAVTVTADLSAVDGTCTAATRYLSKDNTWDIPCYIPDTTYTAGDGITLNTLEFDVNIDTTASAVPESLSTTANQTYQVQLDDQSENLVVNVPWVDTEWYARDSSDVDKTIDNLTYLKFVTATGSLATDLTGTGTTGDPFLMTLTSPNTQNPFQTIAGTGSNNTDSGILLSNGGNTVLVLGDEGIAASQTGDTITLTGTTYALSGIGTNNTDSGIRLTGTGTSAANTDVLILGTGATTVSQTGNTITINSAAGSYNWNVKDNQGTPVSKTLANTEVLQFVMASHASAPTAVLTDTGGNSPYIMTLTGKDTTYTTATTSVPGLAPTLPASAGGKFLKADGTWEVPAYIPDTGIPAVLTDGANPGVTSLYTNTTAAAVRTTIGAGTGDGIVTSLTTTGTSGAATLSLGVLNVPNYAVSDTTYTIDVPNLTTNINLKDSNGGNDAIALTAGTNITIVRNDASQLTFSSTDQYVGTVYNVAAGIGLDTASGSDITGTGTILVDYGPGTGNVITLSTAGLAGGTDIDEDYDYFMWSDSSDTKTVKHSLIKDLPFASSSASGTVTSISASNTGVLVSASTTTPTVGVNYGTAGAGGTNLILGATNKIGVAPIGDDLILISDAVNNVLEYYELNDFPGFNKLGTVTSVTGTAPVVSSGGTTPAISMAAATGSVNGYLTSTDWTTFNNKTGNTGTVTSVGGTGTVSGLTLTGTVTTSGNLTLGGTLSLTSLNITTGLGFTPYNATNPAGYTSNTGTVTSITAAADSGSGSAITTSGTLTFSGGTNVTTSVSGTTVTINSTDQYVGTVTGTGTANYVSKWSSSSAQTNSLLRDDGVGLSVGDSADANYTFYINDQYGYKSNISVNAGVGFYATCAGVLTGTLFKGEASTGVVMTMLQNGTLEVTGDLIAYGSPSDKKLKENIKPIEKALDKVGKLEGVTFDWKENDKEVKQTWIHDIGFIAQDVQKVIPELVRENEDGLLSMRHQGVTPILVEAIKELKAEIEELKSRPCNCNCK